MPHITKVYGPPGTGKTTYLISRVQDEITDGVAPHEIIYTSFTRAAANEARDRALAKFKTYIKEDFPYFSTIHSICFRLLDMKKGMIFTGQQIRDFCDAFGYQLSSANHEMVTEDLDQDIPQMVLSTDADYYEHFIGWMRNLMMQFSDAYKLFSMMPGVPESFQEAGLRLYIKRRNEYKKDKSLFDFTDLIELCINLELWPTQTKVMINDEQQDVSPLLAKLLDMWGSHMERVYLGGDPYQAVYTFMGAEPQIFINAKADNILTLKQSFRCPALIHKMSRKIVGKFEKRYPDDDFIPTGDEGTLSSCFPEHIDWVNLKGKIFYLHRTHWLISKAYDQMVSEGVPFRTNKGRQSPLQTPAARAVATMFNLMELKTVTLKELSRVMDYIPTKGPKNELYLNQGVKAETARQAHENPSKSVNYRDLPQLGFTPNFIKYMKPDAIFNPFKISQDEKNYLRLMVGKYGNRALTDEPRVLLSTIHAVKGKECDTVLLNLAMTHRTYDSLMANPDVEHRLYYVGVTRSKNSLVFIPGDDYESYTV